MTGFLLELAIRFHAGREPVRCLLSFTDPRLRSARGSPLDHSGGGPARRDGMREGAAAAPKSGLFPVCGAAAARGYAAPPGAVSASKIINTVNLMSGAAEPDLQRFLTEHPEVKFFDAFVNDLNTVERGKRIDRGNIAGIFKRGMPLPGSMFALDIEGGTVEATGLGFADGDADRPCMPIPRDAGPRALAARRRTGAAHHARHGWLAVFRRPASSARERAGAIHAPVAHAGGGHRIRVLSRGCRARCARPAAAAERPADRPP